MVDTQWSDVSHFQVGVNDSYPYHFLTIRSNDGTFLDTEFNHNIAWCRSAIHSGKLWGFSVYYFYRPGVDGAKVLMNRVGKPDRDLTVMIDVESASGQVSGNQSGAINAQYAELAKWLGDARRVYGYGNVSDLNALWPQKPKDIRFCIAAYGSNPGYPGKFAHQYRDNAHTAPFGPSDLNSADGMSQQDLQKMYGFTATEWKNWDTKGGSSLQDISDATGMACSAILRVTVQKYGPFDDVTSAYLNGVFDGKVKVTDHIPAGARFWVKASA
jgi:hypothetical protein